MHAGFLPTAPLALRRIFRTRIAEEQQKVSLRRLRVSPAANAQRLIFLTDRDEGRYVRKEAVKRESSLGQKGLSSDAQCDQTDVQQPLFLDPFWTIDERRLVNITDVTSATFWRFLLIYDGHLVRLLRNLTKANTELKVLEDTLLPSDFFIPVFGAKLSETCRRRQAVVLDAKGDTLLYSISWWDERTFQKLDKQVRAIGGWNQFDLVEWEIARRIRELQFGSCPGLLGIFKEPGPYWAKLQTWKTDEGTYVYNYEVLSPKLSKYIGRMSYPTGLT